MTMIVDTTIRTPNDVILAAYCLIPTEAARTSYLKAIEANHTISGKIRIATDTARDVASTLDQRCRMWEIIAFAETF